MSVYYKRTLSLQGANDEALAKPILQRSNLSVSGLTYEAGTVVSGSADASMESFDTIDLGAITTVRAMYIEWKGANFRIQITDADGTSTLRLNSGGNTLEKIWLMEGMEATGVAIKNVDSATAVPYVIALFGDE